MDVNAEITYVGESKYVYKKPIPALAWAKFFNAPHIVELLKKATLHRI